METTLLPKTKLLIIAIFVAFFLSFLLHLMDIQLGFGGYYTRAYFVIMIAIALCRRESQRN